MTIPDDNAATNPTAHQCGSLFGCGEEKGTGAVREDITEATVSPRVADQLTHMDEIEQETLDGFLDVRSRSRRQMLRASSFLGVLAAVGPWFSKLAYAAELAPPGDGQKKKTDKKED